jgi:dienelactone hydrolase
MNIAALFVIVALAGCLNGEEIGSAKDPDVSAQPWDYTVTRSNYTENVQIILGQLGAYTVEIQGTIYEPNATQPDLIIIMHGRHGTCAVGGTEALAPHCPETPATSAVPSMHGYDAFGHQLAKRGFFVVSVDANGVNGMDLVWGMLGDDSGTTARANVLQAHYDYLMANHELNGRVGLIGHSRGGEAVNLAAKTLTPTPGAIFSIAPTDFADHDVEQVPFLVVLPECDGDVSDLQGMDVYRRGLETSGPRYQVWVAGANHNFFNSVWTGDDAGFRYNEGICANETHRLGMGQQAILGANMATSFFQKHLGGYDDGSLAPMQCSWGCLTETHLRVHVPGAEAHALRTCGSNSSAFIQSRNNFSFRCREPADDGWSADVVATAPNFNLSLNGVNYSQFLQFSDDSSHKQIPRTLQFEPISHLRYENVEFSNLVKQ